MTEYIPTLGVEVTPITLKTNYGIITFNCWDTAGQEKFGGLRDGYYIMGSAALLFYDVTCPKDSFRRAELFKRDVIRVCDKVPMVYCATKIDLVDDEQIDAERNRKKKDDIPIALLSSKDRENMFEPLIKLAEQLLKVNNITLY